MTRSDFVTKGEYAKCQLENSFFVIFCERAMMIRLLSISERGNLADREYIFAQLMQNSDKIIKLFMMHYQADFSPIYDLLSEQCIICKQFINSETYSLRQMQLSKIWHKNAREIASNLTALNPFFLQTEIKFILQHHIEIIADMLICRQNLDFASEQKAFSSLIEQLQIFASYVANCIANQFPHLFVMPNFF